MKKLFTLLVLALMVVVMTPDTSKASHMAGVDITYEYAGSPKTLLVSLKF